MSLTLRLACCALAIVTAAFFASGCKSSRDSDHDDPSEALNKDLKKADRLMKKGRYQDALVHLTNALSKSPQDPQIHLNLGWVYLFSDMPDKAREELDKVYQIQPDWPRAAYLEAAMLRHEGKYAEALQWYQKALPTEKGNPRYHYDVALIYNRLERPKDAIASLQHALNLVKKDRDQRSQVLYTLCTTYYNQNQLAAAINYCKQSTKLMEDPLQRQQVIDFTENMKLIQDLDTPAENPRAPRPVRGAPGTSKASAEAF